MKGLAGSVLPRVSYSVAHVVMPTKLRGVCMPVVRLFLAFMVLCVLGCAPGLPASAPEPTQPLHINSVLVLPFKEARQPYGVDSSVRCPVCGAVFETGPIEVGADTYMTKQLVAFLKGKTLYTLILSGAAEGIRSEIISQDAGMSEQGLLVEMGKKLQADAVMNGMIYRFRQRIGTAFSVDTPASVAFGIHLIRVADGRLVWTGIFDETQHSLSENLFQLGTFVRRGGGWLTAQELATFGLHETMATLPLP
jgi:hypothetical protein